MLRNVIAPIRRMLRDVDGTDDGTDGQRTYDDGTYDDGTDGHRTDDDNGDDETKGRTDVQRMTTATTGRTRLDGLTDGGRRQ